MPRSGWPTEMNSVVFLRTSCFFMAFFLIGLLFIRFEFLFCGNFVFVFVFVLQQRERKRRKTMRIYMSSEMGRIWKRKSWGNMIAICCMKKNLRKFSDLINQSKSSRM